MPTFTFVYKTKAEGTKEIEAEDIFSAKEAFFNCVESARILGIEVTISSVKVSCVEKNTYEVELIIFKDVSVLGSGASSNARNMDFIKSAHIPQGWVYSSQTFIQTIQPECIQARVDTQPPITIPIYEGRGTIATKRAAVKKLADSLNVFEGSLTVEFTHIPQEYLYRIYAKRDWSIEADSQKEARAIAISEAFIPTGWTLK